MKSRVLMSCPFCGGYNLKAIKDEPYPGSNFIVRCYDCAACGPEERTPLMAEESWNKWTESTNSKLSSLKKAQMRITVLKRKLYWTECQVRMLNGGKDL